MPPDEHELREQSVALRKENYALMRRGRRLLALMTTVIVTHLEYTVTSQFATMGVLNGSLAVIYPIALAGSVFSLLRLQERLESTREQLMAAELLQAPA